MIQAEESAISTIRNDLQVLKDKVDRMESMMQSMIEIYTDVFCTVREEYVKELEKIESEREFIEFSDFEDLRRSIEES
jgi:CII-binding regulator of phage lambda lysogenization HflD